MWRERAATRRSGWRFTGEHDLRVGLNHLTGGAVETVVRVRSALGGLGLADRLGALDRDRGELGRLLVELIVEDTVQVHRAIGSLLPCPPRAHNLYATNRRPSTLPIADLCATVSSSSREKLPWIMLEPVGWRRCFSVEGRPIEQRTAKGYEVFWMGDNNTTARNEGSVAGQRAERLEPKDQGREPRARRDRRWAVGGP